VSGPKVVTARRFGEVAAALARGQAVALPCVGGYQLAVHHTHATALTGLRGRTAPAAADGPLHMLVGRRAQAMELASQWTKETKLITDRMWPGPLTIIVPAAAAVDEPRRTNGAEPVVHLTMPAWRPLRALCRRSGPLALAPLRGADGEPLLLSAEDLGASLGDSDVAFVVDGGARGGPGPTVVDCTVSPPTVRRVGALPESYVEAALLMGLRRRSRFARRSGPTASS
jgi:L-threonylcarbamoyladenylate synthase